MNLPNLLTLCRFIMIPIYVLVFFSGNVIVAFGIVALAGATDVLDGYLARTRHQVTQVGIMLDPLADKSMMLVVMITLLISKIIPWQAAVAMFAREAGMITVAAILYFRGMKTAPANVMGKLTTVMYYFAILFLVYEFRFEVTYLWVAGYLWFVIFFSFVTSFIYIYKLRALNGNERA